MQIARWHLLGTFRAASSYFSHWGSVTLEVTVLLLSTVQSSMYMLYTLKMYVFRPLGTMTGPMNLNSKAPRGLHHVQFL